MEKYSFIIAQIMQLALSLPRLTDLVERQLENLFIYRPDSECALLRKAVELALARCDLCFSKTKNKYYQKDGNVFFDPFHSGQYCIFLYFVSRELFLQSSAASSSLADRVYYLNKALNGLDLYYEVNMPSYFFLDHPVGSVLGRARYGNGFSFAQNCTVGNNKGIYPEIGNNVTMMAGSAIIGSSTIGEKVIISAYSYIKDENIPAFSLVFGRSPELIIKSRPNIG